MFRVKYEPKERFQSVHALGWANMLAVLVCPNARVRMGIFKASGKFAVFEVQIPDENNRTQEQAITYAAKIRQRIERSPIFRKGP